VRFVGEAVVAVIAATALEARDAAEAVQIDYEPLPAVVDIATATAAGAPPVVAEAPDNIACEARHGDPAAAAAAFARAQARRLARSREPARRALRDRAALHTRHRRRGERPSHRARELPDSDGFRDELCDAILKIPKESVRVVVGDIGGGFGMKAAVYPEDVVVAFAARALKRPVRLHLPSASRSSSRRATAATSRARSSSRSTATGRILALRVASLANMGAYATPAGVAIQLLIGPWVATSIYDIPTIDIGIKAVLTHTLPTGPYRGAGRPEAIYMIERLMDAAARQTGIDRTELRRRNMIRPEQMPYKNPMDKTYDSGQFAHVMDRALALADWKGFAGRATASRSCGKLRGKASRRSSNGPASISSPKSSA
jgi:carbon-monoxide dehydrogenase large subunit